jgi:hypothetical protein
VVAGLVPEPSDQRLNLSSFYRALIVVKVFDKISERL